ncbi:MAG: hypothetical protein IPM36_23980 [Lewinellaceae bacterium]|nr:hypothetical protein [Lewinellaceae bacterium]
MNKIPTLCLAIPLGSTLFSSAFAQTPLFQNLSANGAVGRLRPNRQRPWPLALHRLAGSRCETPNLADAEIDLALVAETNCAEPLSVSFEMLLDLDGDGAPEIRIASDNLADIPAAYGPYNNYPEPALLEWRACLTCARWTRAQTIASDFKLLRTAMCTRTASAGIPNYIR